MEEMPPSELGTQEYWNTRYKQEIVNFEDHGDPGEIWFGSDAVERTINWMRMKKIPMNAKILDLGCGNGMFLIQLADEGYTDLHGMDYSPDAIKLAESIAEKRNLQIKFSVCDILEGLQGEFDLIHDKGTYDAISLNVNIGARRGSYLEGVSQGLRDGGVFVITSCNWTKEELEGQFRDFFVGEGEIAAPKFQFGGKVGSTVATVIFRKKRD